MRHRRCLTAAALICVFALPGLISRCRGDRPAAELERGFRSPPPSARPWVYWFWLNGNITREGITADLEAMQRAGIGGVLIMEVDQGAPQGPVPFAGPQWRDVFQHVCGEADRLGLEVNMNNDAGWCGSGGPWVQPEQAMQKLVWSETRIEGPQHFAASLPRPEAVDDYYRDIAVLAFPTAAHPARIDGVGGKACFTPIRTSLAARASWPETPADATVPSRRVTKLTENMAADGRLEWDAPEGKWTVLRLGHTLTGKDNHPAPESGRGLECDKLSRRAVEAHFDGLMGKLIRDVGPLAGRTLVSTHIDSWEVGVQNWTPGFRGQFQQRRGYDPLPWLPVATGLVVDSVELSERFLWDLRQTISELLLENYAGRMGELAHRHGLRLSIEAYHTCPCDELAYAGRADEPMGEFWSWRKYGAAASCTEMASAAHVYGKRIVGAEAFTANREERWLSHPGKIKDLGDWAFCEGINRFVFHRYALQPWRDRPPGMSMGPWGLHYERTQTWWEQSKAWHEYLARCQFLLRQGRFVADICLLSPEGSPQSVYGQRSFTSQVAGEPLERPGHNFDLCPPEVVLTRMSARDGRLVLPDGMNYRVLALPNVETMTPPLLAKIKELVEAGATVAGAPPLEAPGLSDYPNNDAAVRRLAAELWGAAEPPAEITQRRHGKGRVFWGGELTAWRSPTLPTLPTLTGALWVWRDEGDPVRAAAPGVRYFRRVIRLAPDSQVDSAQLVMTADNAFTCWVNGRQAGAGDNYSQTYAMDVGRLLRGGENVVAVAARNGAEQPNPAALIATLVITLRNGRTLRFQTDRSWQSADSVGADWTTDSSPGDRWASVLELGPLGMAPWGDVRQPQSSPDLYPDIAAIGRLLDRMGVPPDFAYQTAGSEPVLRYIHRATPEVDIYFVANKSEQPQVAQCAFRVRGRRPELWRPRTGRIQRPAVYDETDGRILLPLCFEPHESVFVVFREGAAIEPDRIVSVTRNGRPLLGIVAKAGSEPDGANRASPTTSEPPPISSEAAAIELVRIADGQIEATSRRGGQYVLQSASGARQSISVDSLPPPLTIGGPWQVRFPPGRGAPDRITLDKLIPWNEHASPGVKFYSGAAAYSTTFSLPPQRLSNGRRLILDLGRVEVMAEVRVNGRDLGVLWKPPFRADITDAVQLGDNRLELKVVNLWINRMIGDEQRPEDSQRNSNGTLKEWPDWLEKGEPSPTGRTTFTSWRLWSKDDPLVDSGLLGPVTLQTASRVSVRSGSF